MKQGNGDGSSDKLNAQLLRSMGQMFAMAATAVSFAADNPEQFADYIAQIHGEPYRNLAEPYRMTLIQAFILELGKDALEDYLAEKQREASRRNH